MSADSSSDEAPRPEPGFRVYVVRGDESIDVTHAVMDVYDIAIGSMDFGSGFLSTEEVGNLRALGEAIGAERFDYQHDKCLRCGHPYCPDHAFGGGRCRDLSRMGAWQGGGCDCLGFVRPA